MGVGVATQAWYVPLWQVAARLITPVGSRRSSLDAFHVEPVSTAHEAAGCRTALLATMPGEVAVWVMTHGPVWRCRVPFQPPPHTLPDLAADDRWCLVSIPPNAESLQRCRVRQGSTARTLPSRCPARPAATAPAAEHSRCAAHPLLAARRPESMPRPWQGRPFPGWCSFSRCSRCMRWRPLAPRRGGAETPFSHRRGTRCARG